MTTVCRIHKLRELIAALDRRDPQATRSAETAIARDSSALRARALERISELESEIADRA